MRDTDSYLLRSGLALALLPACLPVFASEPKPTPENTIQIRLADPVKPQSFPRPVKFFVGNLTDRSGNPQPLLVYKDRGGVFLDRQPTEILREGLETSLRNAGALAADADSADLVLNVYVFHFGLGASSGIDFFGKVEFTLVVKNPKTGESKEVKASGTSIAATAIRKKNLQKNVQADIEGALADALRNFLRGTGLRDAVAGLFPSTGPAPAPATPPQPAGLSRELWRG